jgi:predicted DNA-binding transcriptional regulator AlpA
MSAPRTRGQPPSEPPAAPAAVPAIDSLLLDEKQVAAMLGIATTSVCNLESRDPTFPRPVKWALESKRWRRADIIAFVDRLNLRGA